ncbi:MAG: diaminopimelate decarboxylase [Thermoprotei archaeon]|nr:MAG: diaminopimelate decarboxylase [Thermoprotei archaeon]
MKIPDEVIVKAVEKFGTPLYLYSEEEVRERCRFLQAVAKKHYPRCFIAYAYKANSNPALCKIIHEEGLGAEVVSGGELYTALKLGLKASRIVFDGVSKTLDEIEMAVTNEIKLLNVESLDEIKVVGKVARRCNRKISLGVRLNLGVEVSTHDKIATGGRSHKFGLDYRFALKAIKEIVGNSFLEWSGIHFHLGSQIFSPTPYLQALSKVASILRESYEKLGALPSVIDVGGGFGVSYSDEKQDPDLEIFFREIGGKVSEIFSELGSDPPELIIEPGRYIVAKAGILVSRVNYIKENFGRRWLLVDAGMNDFIRPMLYGAKHRIRVIGGRHKVYEKYCIGGPVCESTDVMAVDLELPRVKPGNLIAILDAGAYGYSMASNYNMRPRPPEVLFTEKGELKLIRRRETWEDLLSLAIL